MLERYDAFLLDAYGVLVSSSGPLPGAAAFLRRLEGAGKPYLIVSNDASRLPATTAQRYQRFGLPVTIERILTSGMLLRDHFAAAGLTGAPTIVLGSEDSEEYVRQAGGVVVAADDDRATVVVAADDDGYQFLPTINRVATVLLRRLGRAERTHLVLPNPDLVFPLGLDTFGITAGAIAATLEAVIRLRDPTGAHRFVPLGKPHPPMFEAALRRMAGIDRRRLVMIGDQLGTDILGAQRAGIDTVLVESGVARLSDLADSAVVPTYTLDAVG
ncbi:MAG TPA: HAD-IIA family hydrolase [Polyangia bacterium]|nr:HAD-IIA family hydrolase [Polyangia bacterium]